MIQEYFMGTFLICNWASSISYIEFKIHYLFSYYISITNHNILENVANTHDWQIGMYVLFEEQAHCN